ncbi:MAG: hypothetical protein ACXAEN_19275 [Candidatus Thorarchaeota archaeon]|jgi:hypothetical protein
MMPDADGNVCGRCEGSGVVHPKRGKFGDIFGTIPWLKGGKVCPDCGGAGSFCKITGCAEPSWSAVGLCTEHDNGLTDDLIEKWERRDPDAVAESERMTRVFGK